MEWVKEHISAFGGDPDNITLAGRSAGAYAVHAQTLHDFRTENTQSLYHRIFMCSNAIPAQPKTVAETQSQFDEVCNYFKLPSTLTGPEKLAQLRKISSDDLVGAIKNLQHHTFRPVTDGMFIHAGMIDYQKSPEFAEQFIRRNLKLLIGEVLNEETLYSTYNAPEPNKESLSLQVSNYYAPATTERILQYYSLPKSTDPDAWRMTYGNIVADGQVRAPSRSVARSLFEAGVTINDIWRYQIAYRLSFIDEKVAPLSFGVAHAMDKPLWK
jgi:carboxylesterase type B